MRRRATALIVAAAALASACGRSALETLELPRAPVARAVGPSGAKGEPAPSFVLSDAARGRAGATAALAGGSTGVIVDGMRLVADGAFVVRAARDGSVHELRAVQPVPPDLGGGFLFWAGGALYRADEFDGPLRALTALPDEISRVSFGPRAILVRTSAGDRFALEPRTGARLPLALPGLRDVALVPGAAVALVEPSRVLMARPPTAAFVDVTSALRAPPVALVQREETLWIALGDGSAARVGSGGALEPFAALPAPQRAPAAEAPGAPAWRGRTSPLLAAVQRGLASPDGTAWVAESGDVARVDLRTGRVLSLRAGVLPSQARCELFPDRAGLLAACIEPGAASARRAFVSLLAEGEAASRLEQTFGAGTSFVANDDGALAWVGPCDETTASLPLVVCVRTENGTWRSLDASRHVASTSAASMRARFVPRRDGSAVVLLGAPAHVAVELPSGASTDLDARVDEIVARPLAGTQATGPTIDRAAAVGARGVLTAWTARGEAARIGADGRLSTSPYTFARVTIAAASALGVTSDGRILETIDRGATWTEIEPPPRARQGAAEPRACSSVGCDFGSFYRVGWGGPRRTPRAPYATIALPPLVARRPRPELACRAEGAVRAARVPASDDDDEELDLGARRVRPGATQDGERSVLARVLPATADEAGEGGDPRAVVYGPALLDPASDSLRLAASRSLSFLRPFDTAGTVERQRVTVGELAAAAVRAGVAPERLREVDSLLAVRAVPLTSPSETQADELVFVGMGGVLAATRRGAPPQPFVLADDEATVRSAASIGSGSLLALVRDGTEREQLVRISAVGVAAELDLGVDESGSDDGQRADVVAVGPQGEGAVLRITSAGEPASDEGPAWLLRPGAPAQRLAPWSTLALASAPACRADRDGFRATFGAPLAWLAPSPLFAPSAERPAMLARVRWSPSRVCLEAVELRVGPRDPTPTGRGDASDGWIVLRAESDQLRGAIVRVGPGFEERQPVACSLDARRQAP